LEGEENECAAQLVGKEGGNDVVSSLHGSLIQIETRRKSVEQQAMRRWLQSTYKEERVEGEMRGGEVLQIDMGRKWLMKNKRNTDSMLECTGTEK
jgi:hypothetical protein